MDFDLRDLQFFVAVYEARGFSPACLVLGTVQSNVSTRIKQLETLLGVRLFERRYREVVPTEFGELLYRHAKALIAAALQLQVIAAALKGERAIPAATHAGVRASKAGDAKAA